MSIPRPEYPRPQMVRADWMNLNGQWAFEFDPGCSGKARGMVKKEQFAQEITVPFCPESRLSGIGDTDFHPAVWYRRTFELTELQTAGRTLLHFEAVDYRAEVWVNGKSAGTHTGGCSPFALDVTKLVVSGENTVTVYAEDPIRHQPLPHGKQSDLYESYGCMYTRTTGIWQTVWLEFVPDSYIERLRLTPNLANRSLTVEADFAGASADAALRIEASFDGRPVGSAEARVSARSGIVVVSLSEDHPWSLEDPALYDLTVTYGADTVRSYFGLRDICLRDGKFFLNGKPVFQRLVLDQGFNPEGIYTAPSDDFLRKDIELSMRLGFNGARFHQRIFEARSYYWADKLGYLVWGEFPSWGLDERSANGIKYFVREWTEVVLRDLNHPSLIGWCPYNETWKPDQDAECFVNGYELTRALDPTRIVIDSSGGNHYVTDMYDVHNYEQNPDTFRKNLENFNSKDAHKQLITRGEWQGEPFWVSEYGGTWWNPNAKGASWGYGDRCTSEEEVGDRYAGLTHVLLSDPRICAFCYTQLTDVEQEQNGLVFYDRTPKFSEKIYRRIREANTEKAAVEE